MTKRKRYTVFLSSRRQEKNKFFNRNNKDFLFKYILTDKKILLELYNALNSTDYEHVDDLQINTLKDVIYLGYKNDLSFVIGNTLNLYEHQSTVNPNMPLRGLFYISALYEGYVALMDANLYGSRLIPLPLPQYIVFYNGQEGLPDRQVQHLSDAWREISGEEIKECEVSHKKACLEFTATILNINYGSNKELLSKCRALEEYALFIKQVRDNLTKGMSSEKALEAAIDQCIEENILRGILLKNKAEVKKMILTQFDANKYIAVQRAEGMEEGLETGIRILIEDNREEGISEERILKKLQKKYGLTLSEAEKYMR